MGVATHIASIAWGLSLSIAQIPPPPPPAGDLQQVCCEGIVFLPPQFLKKRSENAGANETLPCGFPSIPGIAPGVAPRIVVFVLPKSGNFVF